MNLKKISVIAVVVGMAVCLVPKSVRAQRAQWSGRSINTSIFTFDIDTTVKNQSKSKDMGFFPGAIQVNFTHGFTNSQFCGSNSCQGNITVTKLNIDASGNILGLLDQNGNPIGLNRLQQFFPDIDNRNDVLRYDITFPQIPNTISNSIAHKFILFIPSNRCILKNYLSGLTDFKDIEGLIPLDVSSSSNGGTFHINPVP